MLHRLLCSSLILFLLAPCLLARPQLEWQPATELGLRGQGWPETSPAFGRLPAKAQESVRPTVWSLGLHSAGLHVDFESNASEIHARWSLTKETLAMDHMPASGASGGRTHGRTTSDRQETDPAPSCCYCSRVAGKMRAWEARAGHYRSPNPYGACRAP